MDDATGCRPDVGPAKSTQFGFVTDAAQAHPHETASQRFGDGLAETRFADTRRANEGQDRLAAAFTIGHRLGAAPTAHCEILEDAVFDFRQPVVITIENSPGMCHIDCFAAQFGPWQVRHPLEVGADHLVLRRAVADALQAAEFAVDFFARCLGEGDLCEAGSQFFDVVEAIGIFAQFFLDGTQLLAQIKLALLLGSAVFDLGTDPLLDLEQGDLFAIEVTYIAQPIGYIDGGQQVNALFERVLGGVAGVVGQLPWVFDITHEVADFLGDVAAQIEHCIDCSMDFELECGKLVGFGKRLVDGCVGRPDNLVDDFEVRQGRPADAPQNDAIAAAGQAPDLLDFGIGGNGDEVLFVVVVGGFGVANCDQDVAVVSLAGLCDCRKLVVEGNGNDRKRQNHRGTEAEDRQFVCDGLRRFERGGGDIYRRHKMHRLTHVVALSVVRENHSSQSQLHYNGYYPDLD